ncbi:MAG: ABC transporter ATP-binding protein [Clostridiales bacterium]|nr:ABC transporter ATP-binding protein [Clostridiales bacterium]
MVEVTDICKSYGGKPVLKSVTFSAHERDFICIVGRNGCGKSTLLNILAGMLKADSGILTVQEGKTIGFTPQADVLFNDLSVNDNLKFWASASGIKTSGIWENECVKILDIEDMKRKKVKNLSGGMKRRVSIAISILKNPDIVILDEPFSALDIFYKKSLTDYLKNLNGMGKTIIYTSHSSDEIVGLCSKVLLIENGEITDRTGEYEK